MSRAQELLQTYFNYFSEADIEQVLDTPKNKKKGKPWDTSRGPDDGKEPNVDKHTHKAEALMKKMSPPAKPHEKPKAGQHGTAKDVPKPIHFEKYKGPKMKKMGGTGLSV